MEKSKDFFNRKDAGNDYVRLIADGKIKKGLGVGCEDTDKHIRFKKGTFNVILGHRNVGKTAFINFYLSLHTVASGYKQLIYSPENTIGNYKRDLVQFLTGQPINGQKGRINPTLLEAALDFISSNYTFVNTLNRWSAFEILDKATDNADSHQILVIDPYNSLAVQDGYRSMNKHDYDYEVASRMRIYCEQTGNTLYLPMHATTESLRRIHKDGKYVGMISPPQDGDAEGGGKWANRCDDFMIVHRYAKSKEEWMNTLIQVDKVKDTATGGKPTAHDEAIVWEMTNYGTKYVSKGAYEGNSPKTTKTTDGRTVRTTPVPIDLMAYAKKVREGNPRLPKINF